jgi:hypothetical protein
VSCLCETLRLRQREAAGWFVGFSFSARGSAAPKADEKW